MRMLAWPATVEPGALDSPISRTMAASNCSSPSTCRSGARSRMMRSASTTLATSLCLALPFVENESSATAGSTPSSVRVLAAVAMAMSASWMAVGSITTPQSAIMSCPRLPTVSL